MDSWNALLVSHVIAALFVLAIGPVQIFRRRRDRIHRTMGYLWVAAMYYVCFSSFWMVSAIRGNIKSHLGNMVGSYIGIAVAFVFAVSLPGRAIPRLLAEDAPTAV